MTKATGPTIPRWRLGEELARLRNETGVDLSAAARELGCSERKIRTIERGEVGISKSDLRVLLDLYQVGRRAHLEELQALGQQRGWWSKYNRWVGTAGLVYGVELSASVIRNWQPVTVPGLLQTEGYVRGLAEGWGLSDDEVKRCVEIRMERQFQVWEKDPPRAIFIIDESVLLRRIGSQQVMAEQLERLLDPPPNSMVQVLPLNRGAHPGTAGSLTLYEFDDGSHSPIASSESAIGLLYLEDQVADAERVITRLVADATDPAGSATMIRDVLASISR